MNCCELLSELMKYKSISCQEIELVEHISSLLNKKNIPHEVDYFNPADYGGRSLNSTKTANIYVEIGTGNDPLVLYSHTDVVPAENSLFMPLIKDNKLFGRGSSDMKASLAALLEVLMQDYENLKRINKKIIFIFIADEETSATGIKRFVEWAKKRNLKDFNVILMEPTNNFTEIEYGGKGYAFLNLEGTMRDVLESFHNIYRAKLEILSNHPDRGDGFGSATLELTKILPANQTRLNGLSLTEGKACHASRPHLGINAIEKTIGSGRKITYLVSSENEGPNSLPSKAHFTGVSGEHESTQVIANIDIRTNLSASENDSLLNKVRDLILKEVKVSLRDHGKAFIVKNQELVELCTKNMPHSITKKIAIGGSDAPYLLELTSNVIAGFGPGNIEVAHTDDEFVSIDILNKTPGIIRQVIKNYLEK